MPNLDCPYCGGTGLEDKEDYTIPCRLCGEKCSYCGQRGDCMHWAGDGWAKAGANKKLMRGPYSVAAKRTWPFYWQNGHFDPDIKKIS